VGSAGQANRPSEETPAERHNRNLSDLLQELRVAGLGVQVLFGFLLSLPFTNRFALLSPSQRGLYEASLLLAASSTALLIAPVAFHRWVFRMHDKERLLRKANSMALVGLATVSLAISSSVLLILSFVSSGLLVSILVVIVVGIFGYLWFAMPLLERRYHSDADDG
jgi:putative flippase GtrA